jgi:hypothetical protein
VVLGRFVYAPGRRRSLDLHRRVPIIRVGRRRRRHRRSGRASGTFPRRSLRGGLHKASWDGAFLCDRIPPWRWNRWDVACALAPLAHLERRPARCREASARAGLRTLRGCASFLAIATLSFLLCLYNGPSMWPCGHIGD